MILAVLTFRSSLVELIEVWMDADRPYSHGMLVGPIAVALVLQACFTGTNARISSSWLALIFFAGSCLIWLMAFSADILAVQHVLFPVILVLAVAVLVGWRMAAKVAFPLLFLYFAIPIWSYAIPVLQGMTVGVVRFVLDLVQIPVYVEENRVTIPEGVFEIADGCAGLHYFVVALTISSLYSYLNFERRELRVVFVVIAAGIAIFTNWIRVGSLVLFGHFTDMQHYLITHEHYYYGWVLYAIALIPTFAIAYKLRDRDSGPAVAKVPWPPALQAGTAGAKTWVRPKLPIAVGFGFLLLLSAAFVQLARNSSAPQHFDLALPSGEEGWELVSESGSDWIQSSAGADGQQQGAYLRGDTRIDVSMAVYRSQSQGRELVVGDSQIYGVGFAPISAARVPVQGIDGLREVQELIVRAPDGRERIIWRWYVIGERLVTGDLRAKLWQFTTMLVGRDSGAVVAISAACSEECALSRSELRTFAAALGNEFSTAAIAYQIGTEL
jgi:exosortase A